MWWRVAGMADGAAAIRRVQQLTSTLAGRPQQRICLRMCSSAKDGGRVINIGDVTMKTKVPHNKSFVPVHFLPDNIPQSILQHLKWIMQKDLLGQDVFLIGPPGPLRRSLAMMYLQLTDKESEYVSLSRDTTETDLKQRREIRGGTAYHIDQSAVKAATEGRILVLEGIEKAERNVLPVLNNLLENREMQLDDGRFLMHPTRYDKLLKEHSQEELDSWKLVRVSDDFRVIALGLPVPRYQGNPLDPPLRSRFQARDIHPLPYQDTMELLKLLSNSSSVDRITKILSCASTLRSDESSSLGLQDFPLDNLPHLIKIMEKIPSVSSHDLIQRLYPYEAMMSKEGRSSVEDVFKSFEIDSKEAPAGQVAEVRRQPGVATVQLQKGSGTHNIQVASGKLSESSHIASPYISTKYHDSLVADLMSSHLVHDICLIGPRGCGKSVLAKHFADLLGYHVEPIMLYQDMTSRDLLQQRMTLPNGDTTWRPSPLVTAALEGSLALLDGVHRVNAGTFAVLHRLIHDRELALFDGTRLLRHDKYDHLKESEKASDEEMANRGIMRIDPAFRIMALSEPPQMGSSSQQWLNSELLTMFLYHNMRSLSKTEEVQVLKKLVPNMTDMQPVMELTHKLRLATDSNLKSVGQSLSTRQLLRIARRLSENSNENLYDVVQKACLGRFLPRLARTALDEELELLDVQKPLPPKSEDDIDKALTCEIKDGMLRIGGTTVQVHDPDLTIKVPDVLFYENPQHLAVMEDMLKDYLLGEHLLLVGNQGVGKNKIIDRFLYLLNRPREYIQLHRDTTVQTLTLQPTVQDGVIKYEDSPLVKSVKNGHILVVDEADKAPTNVTCILKTLVESGEMHLSDGRRIVSARSGIPASENVIVAHPDFRMFVLANRPGFPFLGNDFFGAMGDLFSCHAVDNPDMESEMSMLRQYGPDVPEHVLRKLVQAFGDLRDMADQGLINYPYSTREVVNMVKHLQMFPNEGITAVVRNVFDFDSYNKELKETVIQTLHKHGIPLGADPNNVALAKDLPLPPFEHIGTLNIQRQSGIKKSKLMSLPVEDRKLSIKGPVQAHTQSFPLERTEARSMLFTEQEAFWTLPLHETAVIADVAVTKASNRQPRPGIGDLIHVATANPVSLYTMDPRKQHLSCMDLYDLFPSHRGSYSRPRLHIAPLGFPLDSNVLLFEGMSNILLDIDFESGEVRRIERTSFMEAAADKLSKNFRQQQGVHKMCADLCHEGEGMVLMYKEQGQSIDVIHMLEGRCHSIELPFKLDDIHMLSKRDWLVTEYQTARKFMLSESAESVMEYTLQPIQEVWKNEFDRGAHPFDNIDAAASTPLDEAHLGMVLDQKISSPNRVLASKNSYAHVAVGLPDLTTVDVYSSLKETTKEDIQANLRGAFQHFNTGFRTQGPVREPVLYLPETGQIVRTVGPSDVPEEVYPQSVKPKALAGFLQVSDIANHKLRHVPIPGVQNAGMYSQWFNSGSTASVLAAGMSNDAVVTVDSGGCVRLWETALASLDQSIEKWRGLIGKGDGQPLTLAINERELPRMPGDHEYNPKHGKMDPTGAPHVGGGTWAGGSGGRNTAGLGGVGGPYRLDIGQDVSQVPDWQKDMVPEEVRRAAREMGEKAFRERLKQIKMSEYDGELYERFSQSVRRQVTSFKVILDSLQAKGKERQWLKHQSQGDLDDAKLIEGLAGERAIYKRRGEKEPELGSPQQKPKYVKILCDVSGSMYRFNGYDGRLEREMESMVMVMEGLEGYEHKIKYDIIGHSGEGCNFEIVKNGTPPKNNKDRLDAVKTLHAHAQFCISGDHTVEAAEHAVKTITNEEADEHFVIILSDANLERYGIRPRHLTDALTANEDVNAYVIFIGSLGDQATRLIKQLPSGKAFICLDTKNLPSILQQIFTSTMLNTR